MPNLLYNRAFANSKIGFVRDAISDCTKALKNSWAYSKFLMLRAKCHMNMRNFRKCVDDIETLLKIENTIKAQIMLQEARVALKRSQSNNYYDILDINKHSSQEEIKKAYKKLSLIHHPDKHSSALDDERHEQQEIFKKISVAYETLSDPVEKAIYDRKNSN